MIIVEDGTGVDDANSYVSVADHIAYASSYGITVDAVSAAINLLKAMDYIETRQLKGQKVYPDLDLHFPANYVYVNNKLLPNNKIPKGIIKAENEIALAVHSGSDVLGVSEPAVVSKTFGPFSKTYQSGTSAYISAADINPRLDLFLQPYIDGDASGITFKVVYPCGGWYGY